MFYYLQGPIAILEPNLAVVDCGGVGYACAVTAYTAAQLKLNQTARLYIHENIREAKPKRSKASSRMFSWM